MKPAKLIVQDHEGSTRTYDLAEPETLIGRSPTNQVCLNDQATSRDHAAISWEDDHYVIEDLQTTNGTKVNGKRVRSCSIEDGDTIQMGKTTITFRYA